MESKNTKETKMVMAKGLPEPAKNVFKESIFNRYGYNEFNGYTSMQTQMTENNDSEDFANTFNANQTTGSADINGLKEIGWKKSDILYFKTFGVTWGASEDKTNKVSEENKALLLTLNKENISKHNDNLKYCPYIDMSGLVKNDASNFFNGCTNLVAVPSFNTKNVVKMDNMFSACSALKTIPMLDATNVTSMKTVFNAALVNFGGFKDLNCNLDLKTNTNLTKQSLLNVINNLRDNSKDKEKSSPQKTLDLTGFSTKLGADGRALAKAVAEKKYWTITVS